LESQAPVDLQVRIDSAARVGPSDSANLYRRAGKRLLDIVLSLVLLAVLSPLLLLVALLVLLSSGWPVLYSAPRLGRGGREFAMWKFRTMVRDADKALARWQETHPDLAEEYEQHFKLRDDPRITALGRFLRRSSLDELPQLWNVLRGDMSLVGPRPIAIRELARYGSDAPELLSVKPGITGRWQMDGRNDVTYPARVQVELQGARSMNLASDLLLLLRTVAAPLKYNGR
jgi:lipopolysaccharide/colanic/teichoic acid biosynthesis glycosyltransferase